MRKPGLADKVPEAESVDNNIAELIAGRGPV